MFALMTSRMSLTMGHVGSKTRSPGQILEKSDVHSWGHIFSLVLLKVGHGVCLDDISNEFDLVLSILKAFTDQKMEQGF